MTLWPKEYKDSLHPNGSVHELLHLMDIPPFTGIREIRQVCEWVRDSVSLLGDKSYGNLPEMGCSR